MGVGTSFAILEAAVDSGENFEPTLNAGVVLSNLSSVFKGFVVGV